MMRQTLVSASMVLAFGTLAIACESGGVGDPCIPNDEFSADYAGATEKGAQIEDRSFQCETRVCLVKNFRGRVTCPFGNREGRGNVGVSNYSGADAENCIVPGTNEVVTKPVNSQCAERRDDVYCSCRCDGLDTKANYCECPEGFECRQVTQVLDPTLIAPGDKYCVRVNDEVGLESWNCPSSGGCHEVPDHCGYSSNTYEF